MVMPERSFSNQKYRWGFNGQEHDRELNPSITTAEFWEYDGRLGRRWNIDPVVKSWESGYATFYNNPIAVIDPLGLSGTTTTDEQGCVEYSGDATNSSTGETQNVQGMTPEQMNDFSLVPSASEAVITADRIDHPINEPNSINDRLGINPFKRVLGTFESLGQLAKFATGKGDQTPYIMSNSGYAYMMRGSPGVAKALEQYAKTGDEDRLYFFTPSKSKLIKGDFSQVPEAIEAHMDVFTTANIPRLTIGGYNAVIIKPVTGSDVLVRVQLINNMSLGSLMAHLDYFQNNPPKPGYPFSTVSMTINLGLFDISGLKQTK